MTTLLLAFGLMLTIVGAMAIGVLMGQRPIAGSCGGLAALGIDGECEICGGNPNACESVGSDAQDGLSADQFVDATKPE